MPYRLSCTGHRPNKLGGYNTNPVASYVYKWLSVQAVRALIQHEDVEFISGMAIGVDTIFAAIALKAKQLYPDRVHLLCAVPFETHSSNWPTPSVKYYDKLLSKADEIVMVSKGGFTPQKMQARNEFMVDRCDELLAVWDGETVGGTWNCVKYAREKEKKITYIDQKRLKTYQQIEERLRKG